MSFWGILFCQDLKLFCVAFWESILSFLKQKENAWAFLAYMFQLEPSYPMLVLPLVKFGMTNPVLGLGDGLLQELFLLHKAFTCGQPNEAAYSFAFAVEKTIDK
jgi:hypothetical protein